MLKEFTSYRAIRQRKIKEKCLKMRKAKEVKKLSLPLPGYPVEITENCFEITIKRYINRHMIEKNYFLNSTHNPKLFDIWDRTIKDEPILRGVKGQQKAFKLISGDFPRIRRGE